MFSDQEITISVDENTPSGRDIGDPVTADDPEDDTLTYSLTGDDASSFSINPSTGQIRTNAALDYEARDTYHFAVQVRDGKNLDGNVDAKWDHSVDVIITVENVNEPPEFDANAPATLNVLENTAAGENIGGPVTATDPEEDTLTYLLDTGDGAAFQIDASGQITTKDPIDRETKASYSVTVSVHDGKDAQGNADETADDVHTVRITVGDENDAPVFDEGASTTRFVLENTPAGQPVGDPVSATDEDSGNRLTYSLGGEDASSFDIDTSTGQIKTKAPLDLETEDSYSVTVSVHDGKDDAGNTETPPTPDDTIDVTITVTDGNDPPEFAQSTASRTVPENTAPGQDIGQPVTADDPDTGDTLTYSLKGADAASFDIVDSSGQIRVREQLDFEASSSYSVTVSVTDGKDVSGNADHSEDDSIEVTITVTNVDEDGVVTLSTQHPGIGVPVTATLVEPDGVVPTVAWKWEKSTDKSSWSAISGNGADTDSYTPQLGEVGSYLRATANYTDPNFTNNGEKSPSAVTENQVRTNAAPAFDSETATRSMPRTRRRDGTSGLR